ncbi:hypothetical protein [Actinoplanes sp. NPDC026619]|uniref:hypothetical protein n=1 Tax=Actinoplanes sp. NPDC026619 TaxID=3155798 RepID=UPI0033DB56D8
MRLFLVVIVLLSTAGCGGSDVPAVTPAPSVAPSESSAADDPSGSAACARLAAAVAAGSLMDAGVADDIVSSSRTADAPLADSADRLEAAYRAAVAAAGKADEPDKVAAVSAAASDMSGVCAESGLQTVG